MSGIPLAEFDSTKEIIRGYVPMDRAEAYKKATEEGYRDEICPECSVYFAPYHHFVRCQHGSCPMANGVSLMEQILGGIGSPRKN